MRGLYFWLRMARLYTSLWSLETLGVCKHTNEKIDSHTTKIWRAFRRSVPFFEIFLETDVGQCEGRTFGWGRHDSIHPHRVWKLLGFTSVLMKRWTLALPKFDEPFGIRFHFLKTFLETDVGQCEGRTFGWGRHDSIHPYRVWKLLGFTNVLTKR